MSPWGPGNKTGGSLSFLRAVWWGARRHIQCRHTDPIHPGGEEPTPTPHPRGGGAWEGTMAGKAGQSG